jgi:hypothetical protein
MREARLRSRIDIQQMMPELISPPIPNLRDFKCVVDDLGKERSIGSIVAVFEARKTGR